MSDELDNLLRLDDVKRIVPMSTSMLYKLMAAGKFPRPMKVGDMSRWSAREIAEWQRRKMMERESN